MNLGISVGENEDGQEICLDLKTQDLNLILLVGQTGTGKSIFHFNLYRQLLKQNPPKELGFLIIDNTRVDFYNFRASHLIKSCVTPREALTELKKIQEELVLRSTGKKEKAKAIFIHIEECDLFISNPVEMKDFMNEFVRLKKESNVYLLYSTSRPSVETLPDWLIGNADLKVVFNLTSETDSQRVLGNNDPLSLTKPGEHILLLKEGSYRCGPFNEGEYIGDENYVNGKDAGI